MSDYTIRVLQAPATQLNVTNQVSQIIKIVSIGPQGPAGAAGPQGPSGTGDKHEVFTQLVPATIWNISHGLSKFPSTTVLDSAGDQVIGDVQQVSNSAITITFSAPFGGVCYLN